MPGEWELVGRLALTLALSAAVGLEREYRQKSAGLRTHTLVGVGAALFTLAGAYGFAGETGGAGFPRDPSRVAAQVVTGIGFIGGGLIFVRRDAVRGLTTAAGVWVTAAIGVVAGAGLRTHTLVGLGAALFSLAGAYGFASETGGSGFPRDPSRVAAQVVTGIGFIGGGLIFVRQDAVRGLTTAAGVWLVAGRLLGTSLAPAPLTGLVGELDGVLVVHGAETDPD